MLSTTEVLPIDPHQLLQRKYAYPTDREEIALSTTEELLHVLLPLQRCK